MRERKTSTLGLYVQLVKLYIWLRLPFDEPTHQRYLRQIIAVKKTLRQRQAVPSFLPKLLNAYHSWRLKLRTFDNPINYWRGWIGYGYFLSWKITRKTILLIEANHGHNQVAESMINNFLRLGYLVDFVSFYRNSADHPEEPFVKNKRVRFLFTSYTGIKRIVYSQHTNNYKWLFFNSIDVITLGNWWENCLRCFPPPQNAKFGLAGICHNGFVFKENQQYFDQVFLLGNLPMVKNQPEKIIYPLDFGFVDKEHHLKKIKQFIVVGALDPRRRDTETLFAAVRKLLQNGINNFKIVTVGHVVHTVLPVDIAEYFEVRGYLSYPEMYRLTNESDFVLALLNPNSKFHQNYVKRSVTGNYLTSYVHYRPLIVHNFFAKTYGFNRQNSLIYEGQDLIGGLAEAMGKAIAMKDSDYQLMTKLLKKQKEQLIEVSLKNLKQALQNEAK